MTNDRFISESYGSMRLAQGLFCDGVKCMSVISMSVCLYLVNGAKRCGGGRCGAMRSGAANTERSDDDLEEERGKHQRDPKVFTNQQTCHYLDHFGAQLLRPTCRFRPVSISGYLTCYLATHSCR